MCTSPFTLLIQTFNLIAEIAVKMVCMIHAEALRLCKANRI